MPRWQGIIKFGWTRDRHSVALRGQYKHHVNEDDTLCALPGSILTGIKSFVGEVRGAGGGMETFLYDPRGRQWYLRLQTEV